LVKGKKVKGQPIAETVVRQILPDVISFGVVTRIDTSKNIGFIHVYGLEYMFRMQHVGDNIQTGNSCSCICNKFNDKYFAFDLKIQNFTIRVPLCFMNLNKDHRNTLTSLRQTIMRFITHPPLDVSIQNEDACFTFEREQDASALALFISSMSRIHTNDKVV
jgi:hypothetical protein